MIDGALWVVALVGALAPRRVWSRLEPPLPLRSAAVASALLTLVAGFLVGVDGFFTFASQLADANNAWMLQHGGTLPCSTRHGACGSDLAGLVPYGMSVLTLFIFLFFTPTGLFAVYLVTTGAVRAISAGVGDPRGDPLLSALHWAATRTARGLRAWRARVARESREGAETPDLLHTGAWAGLDVDYVLLASRRKPEWNAGVIVMTGADWYRLGVPFDMEMPAGLRVAYPLKKLEAVEVVRRGIVYELPPLG